jgi:hypothetical protein
MTSFAFFAREFSVPKIEKAASALAMADPDFRRKEEESGESGGAGRERKEGGILYD